MPHTMALDFLTRALLTLAFLAVLSAFLLIHFTADAQNSEQLANKESRIVAQGEVCCGEADKDSDKPHLLAGSYYSLKDNLTPTLMLNNKGPRPLEVEPTLFSLDGQRLALAPVVVEPTSFRTMDMREWAAQGGANFDEGSLQLFHRGKDLVLGAQIHLVDDERSLSFEEKLTELTPLGATRLEAVWWLPTARAGVQLILSNTKDEPLSVTARFAETKRGAHDAMTIELAPHSTRVFDVHGDLIGRAGHGGVKVEAVSLEHSGANGALLARAMVQDKHTGYSSTVQFSPPSGKSSQYHGAGLRLGSIDGETLMSVVVARNVGTTPTVLSGRMPYTTERGQTGIVTVPKVRLEPGEIVEVELDRAIKRRRIRGEITTAGLELEYSTAPGSVIVSAHSMSRNGNHVFRVPMWDPLAQRSSTGGYPWRIEGSSSTNVYIKNITDRKQRYIAYLHHPDGIYMIGSKEVEEHQTIAIDVRALRDSQVPDENGETIPLDTASGQFQWTLEQTDEPDVAVAATPFDDLALIGRSEQSDLERAISSNYACLNCCNSSTTDGRLKPENEQNDEPGDTRQFTAEQQKTTCYGISTWSQVSATGWGTSDGSVATVNSSGLVTAQDGGNVNINATFNASMYYQNEPCGGPYPYLTAAPPDSGEFESLAPGCGACVRYGYAMAASTGYTVKPAEPHHVKVVVDQSGYPASCATTGVYLRQIQVQVVNKNNKDVKTAFSVKETYANLSTNTCGNGNPVASGCAAADTGGRFLDSLAVSGNLCGSGISQSSGCGFTLTSTWSICAGFTARNIWTSTRETRSNDVKVNGQSSNYAPGTQLYP